MLTEKQPAARKSPAERLSGRTYKDYRRAFDQIISSAAEGRMTLEVLKDIGSNLLRFFRCSASWKNRKPCTPRPWAAARHPVRVGGKKAFTRQPISTPSSPFPAN
jgi:hypothetical protein